MKEITGDVWDYYGVQDNIICIPTNGDVNNNLDAVMGRGIAAQATNRIPGIASELGFHLRIFGNDINWLDSQRCLSFPVKHHWKEQASLDLIQKSRNELKDIAECLHNHRFYLPRPGCGNGNLDYKDVRPLMLSLPDNVFVISFDPVTTDDKM